MQDITMAQEIAQTLYKNKANHILALDVRELTVITDYMVIASGRSANQVKALADCYDLACSLVAENDLFITKGVIPVLVNVGAANAAALNLDENFTGSGGRDLDVSELDDSLALYTVNEFRFHKICDF